jgi:hypothetical protein
VSGPEWPFECGHPDVGCQLFFGEAKPLLNAGRFADAVPVLERAFAVLLRCGLTADSPHPQTQKVLEAFRDALQQTGSSAQEIQCLIDQIRTRAVNSNC